jgi:carbon monoxide dehydrogenase subunit G
VKIAGEYVFDGPREGVWELFRDPDVLVTALPGAQSIEQVGENEYVGNMHVRVGPVSGVFSGRIVISNEVPPESYTMTVEGKGRAAFVKASGDVQLIDQGDDTTLMKYGGQFQVGGRLVSVGQRLIDSVSKKMLRQGLDTLNEALKERVAAESAG